MIHVRLEREEAVFPSERYISATHAYTFNVCCFRKSSKEPKLHGLFQLMF